MVASVDLQHDDAAVIQLPHTVQVAPPATPITAATLSSRWHKVVSPTQVGYVDLAETLGAASDVVQRHGQLGLVADVPSGRQRFLQLTHRAKALLNHRGD
jgi:hypothetical protein